MGEEFWRLWLKKPSWEKGRVLPRPQFPSFAAMQQWVAQSLDGLPRAIVDPEISS
jgi:hypothetical protein